MPNVCPLCKKNEAKVLYGVSSDFAARHFAALTNTANYVFYKENIGNLWKENCAEVKKCRNCGLVFVEPFCAGDDRFYSLFYDNSRIYPEDKWDFTVTLAEIIKQKVKAKADLQILEIGSGNGSFIAKFVAKIGSVGKITCVENSEFCAGELNKLPVNNVYKDLNEFFVGENGTRYDYIFMFQVLEHLDDFQVLFGNVDKILADDGCIFITVPNFYQRELYDEIGIHADMPPMHVSRWSINAFQYLAEKHDLRIAKYRIQPEKYVQKIIKLLYFIKNNIKASAPQINQTDSIAKMHLMMRILLKLIMHVRTFVRLKNMKFGTTFWVALMKK